MSDVAMAIIDGTGPWSDAVYAKAMKHSFCAQLRSQLGAMGHYERGPSGEGYRIEERASRAVDFLKARHAVGSRLMLAGYSRGGSAAVIAARMLEEAGLQVTSLFLFDPVARHASASSALIPGNVRSAWIARRRIGAKEMDRYDYTLLGDLAGHNPVRNWFGTTADKAAAGVKVSAATFLGSHGALGGVGWKHVREDSLCQSHVAEFMNRGLAACGVPAALASTPPA
jgi:dienelactone hydrolase